MSLPVTPPVKPMLAKAAHDLPLGEGLVYEPKWDGFRSIVFMDGPAVTLASRNERELTRYFPELVVALRHALAGDLVLDGEIVIAGPAGLDFDALSNRIHPAASRVALLSEKTPASFVAFDALAFDGRDLRSRPFAERRAQLEAIFAAAGQTAAAPSVLLTPATSDPSTAAKWFARFEGAGLDGVMVKEAGAPYVEGKRVMTKVKHERTADCVVGGFRWHRAGTGVGSLLLGLYDGSGVLHHVGVTSSFSDSERRDLVGTLAPLRADPRGGHPWADESDPAPDGQRRPGSESRWSAGRDLSFEALRPELVCEVAYDHLQQGRFRHTATFRRFRPDREPSSCRYDQLEAVVPEVLETVLRGG